MKRVIAIAGFLTGLVCVTLALVGWFQGSAGEEQVAESENEPADILSNGESAALPVPLAAGAAPVVAHVAPSRDYRVLLNRMGSVHGGLLAVLLVLAGFCGYQFHSRFRNRTMVRNAMERLENRLSECEAELACKTQIIEEASAGVFICDLETGHFRYANEFILKNLGYPLDELRELTLPTLTENPDPESLEEMLDSLKTGSLRQILIRARHVCKDQTRRDVEIRLQKIPYQGRDALLANVVDMTDRLKADAKRRKLRKKLNEVSRAAGTAELATGVLHNVGNILNSVNVSASMIRQRFAKSAVSNLDRVCGLIREHEESFADFVSSDDRGQKLPGYLLKVNDALCDERTGMEEEVGDLLKNIEHIRQIITIQQTMAGTSGTSQPICPRELLRDVLAATKGSLVEHHISVAGDLSGAPETLVSDKHKILQVLVNLVGNARDALLEHQIDDPTITIRVSSRDDRMVFEVSDNGIGIPEDKLDKIFRHGFTTKANGHGFGLHSSANVAAELNGTLTASSEGVGQGATFTLSLPVCPDQDEHCPLTETEAETHA